MLFKCGSGEEVKLTKATWNQFYARLRSQEPVKGEVRVWSGRCLCGVGNNPREGFEDRRGGEGAEVLLIYLPARTT